MAIRDYDSYIDDAAAKNGLNPDLLRAVIEVESNWNPRAISRKKDTGEPIAYGLMQFTPGTAKTFGINPLEDIPSIYAGAKYLRQNHDRFGGDTNLALAAYNAGPGAVEKYGGVPPFAETRAYVPKVYGAFQKYASLRTGTATDAQPATMARQTEAAPEVQPVSIQRNIAPITGLTRTEDVVNQVVAPSQAQPQEQDQDLLEIQRAWEAKQQAQQPSSEDADLMEIQKAWEAKQAANKQNLPGKMDVRDYVMAGADTGGVDIAQLPMSHNEAYQAIEGAKEGALSLARRFGSLLPASVANMGGEGLHDPRQDVSRQEQARAIQQRMGSELGLGESVQPTTLPGYLARGSGQMAVTAPELAGAASVVRGATGLMSVPKVVQELSPGLVKALEFASPSLKNALTFASIGATEPEDTLKHTGIGAAAGATLGLLDKLPGLGTRIASKLPESIGKYIRGASQAGRIAGAGGVGAGQSLLNNPEATPSDITAQALLNAGFSGLGGIQETTKKIYTSEQIRKITDEGVGRGVQPKFKGNKTWDQVEGNMEGFSNAATDIARAGVDGRLELPSGKNLPQNNLDHLKAIHDRVGTILKEQNADVKSQTGQDAHISDTKVLEALENKRTELMKLKSTAADPGIAAVEAQIAKIKEKPGGWSFEEALDEISAINNNPAYKEYISNPSPDHEAAVAIQKVYVDALRSTAIEDVGRGLFGERFEARRELLRDLIKAEPLVAHRAIAELRAPEKGFFNVTDPLAASHVVVGLAMSPIDGAVALSHALKGVTMKTVSKIYKEMNKPSNVVKDMYRKLGEGVGPAPVYAEPVVQQPQEPTAPAETKEAYYNPATGAQPSPPVGVPAAATAPPTNREVVSGLPRQIKVVPQTQSKVPIVRPENLNPAPVATPQSAVDQYIAAVTGGGAGGGGVPQAPSTQARRTVSPAMRELQRRIGQTRAEQQMRQSDQAARQEARSLFNQIANKTREEHIARDLVNELRAMRTAERPALRTGPTAETAARQPLEAQQHATNMTQQTKQPWEMTVQELSNQEGTWYKGKQYLIPREKFILIGVERNYSKHKDGYHFIRADGQDGGKVPADILKKQRDEARARHRYYVEKAMSEGKSIPPEVLSDYRDLS